MAEAIERWWEPLRMEVGDGWQWELGPLDFEVYREATEWHLAYEYREYHEQPSSAWFRRPSVERPELGDHIERFAAGPDAAELTLRPRVADRTVVALPRTPLWVLPGERAKVYVSSPLWVDFAVGPPPRPLRELPVKRLSDTWVGPSTTQGEVAYALKTHARISLDDVPKVHHRCVTPVEFANEGKDVLRVERMNLPIPYLSLYVSQEGHLWTEGVTLVRSEDDRLARLDIARGTPPEAIGAEQISEARRAAEPNLLVQAFSSLLRTLGQEADDG